ncbi:hypothetical protein QES_0241 [Clostridioides difficile CD149]|uniref:Uncharacterized protein n=1 Tax=Clostridioides difficile ATCC 9689 = DSM 1296 TaxID=1121308 RepID=A0ACA7UP15_CLODI|nr:hypothetical protein [Clostridioides difficile]YP_009221735.1 hypothetical protein PHICD211_20132 [Clostridium phage phiCD211]AKP44811.1 hypothetical protein CDIF1296T_phi137 [Peptoclostridium phage phiCDIF1296T]CCL67119.1 hypothetical protein BN183_3840006 [Clostridioides difficile E7]EIJ0743003.1 hypothetical protein [Clostridioides difficile]EJA6618115.1 hypothetical protein [Clostridioides difficile]EJA6629804.1 hypothetical protein [Clostridioides difficile]
MLENLIKEYFLDSFCIENINTDMKNLEIKIDNIYNCLNNTLNENQRKLLSQFDELLKI